MKAILKISLVSLISSGLTFMFFISFYIPEKLTIEAAIAPIAPMNFSSNYEAINAAPTDFVLAANKSIGAVVHIKNTANGSSDNYLDYFLGEDRRARVGTGSGVIVSPDGYVLTNNHVIENATKLEVTTNDNKRYQATLVATDPATDIAVLKIDTDKPLPYLYFGDSDQTRIGEWVLAIGNPFNLNSTVTAGIISAKSRDLNDRDSKNQSYIQTDAAVNMGNSGGALVNTSGELIGINTAITSMSGGFEGYSFAIPSNIARKVFEDLVEFGSVKKGLIGIFGTPVTPDLVASENLSLLEGVYIREVQKGMGAEKAGLKEEDIITQIDDIKIKTFSDLTGYIESKHPGDRVTVEYYRNGEAKTTEVTLEVINQVRFMQMTIENFTAEEKKEMNLDYGLRVLESGAYMYEIRPNSVLLKVNEQPLSSIDDLRKFDRNNIQNLEYLSPNGEKERISFRRR
tara:strand:+ start:900 stop:2270 length:1371 start_codon:yes stop_codon:yes gene_type:complete